MLEAVVKSNTDGVAVDGAAGATMSVVTLFDGDSVTHSEGRSRDPQRL